ncbi:hypothetical protein Trichorick_01626 (plasmid) [Candidatus Trichorickettsia mobilis]|jgi:hypothetical protein|nr:hypothetical protein Trichorick_01626 [Candidatus Trichorickettsia mobilis]
MRKDNLEYIDRYFLNLINAAIVELKTATTLARLEYLTDQISRNRKLSEISQEEIDELIIALYKKTQKYIGIFIQKELELIINKKE